MLIYERQEGGDHVWTDTNRKRILWRGSAFWYTENPINNAIRLCPSDWTDGEAIGIYFAKCRLSERPNNGSRE